MRSIEHVQAELQALPEGDTQERLDLLAASAAQFRSTSTAEALAFAQQALHIAERRHDALRIAECLNLCALCHWHMSMYKQALEEAFSALRLYEHRDQNHGTAMVKNTIGMIYRNLSDYNQALAYHNQALELVEQSRDTTIIAETLTNIGIIHHRLANYADSLKFHHRSLTLCLEHGIASGQSTAYRCTGNVYFDLKDYYQAINNYQQSLSLSEQSGDRWSEAIALESIGMVCEKMRDLDEAMIFFRRSLSIRQEIGDKFGQASALFHLGLVFQSGRNDKQAINFFKLSLTMRREVHDRFGEAETLLGYGKVYFNEASEYHNSILAVEQFQSALKIANELGAKQLMFRAHKLLSKCYKQIDMYEKALFHYEQFYAIRKNVGGDEASLKIKQMEIKIATEVSEKETEIQRLKNDELAQMMKEVEELNADLLDLNREKTEFLSIVSHDLKNPIAGILLNVSTIERYAQRMSIEELLKQVRTIGETAERMKGIVHRMLDARTIESGE
ncbi:MAG: tetratricopeptide repeat protein, partial [Candidatus Kapabacteria bacterium]|nr:tetratricopeptide repeat protein [Candidatus Kapabacteria bacterium]